MSASSWVEPLPVAASATESESVRWSLATRVAFRFCFGFLLLYNFPFPLDLIPKVSELVSNWWGAIVPPFAQAVFGVAADVPPNGSGDTTWNYVQLFMMVAIAALVTLVWSIIDRRALAYPRLYRFLRVYVRFALAAAMLSYGAAKVAISQFPSPTIDRLVQPFGDASPMGLLWTFIGASAAYEFFIGLGEVVSGLLLTTRRTTLAGALLTAGVMTHVAVLNFCYDVPVKLYSSFLLFEALFLIAPDVKRLVAFFTAGGQRAAWWKIAIRTVAVLAFLAYSIQGSWELRKTFGDLAPKSPLFGIWNVDELTENGVSRPPLMNDATRWRRMVFVHPKAMSIQLMSDKRMRFLNTFDEGKKSLVLTKRDDPKFKATFTYLRSDPRTLTIDGAMEGRTYHAILHRADDAEFLLRSRGFHWINEYPFNR